LYFFAVNFPQQSFCAFDSKRRCRIFAPDDKVKNGLFVVKYTLTTGVHVNGGSPLILFITPMS
jgi:hypothetical protein